MFMNLVREDCKFTIKLLQDRRFSLARDYLLQAFLWGSSPQGYDYWMDIEEKLKMANITDNELKEVVNNLLQFLIEEDKSYERETKKIENQKTVSKKSS